MLRYLIEIVGGNQPEPEVSPRSLVSFLVSPHPHDEAHSQLREVSISDTQINLLMISVLNRISYFYAIQVKYHGLETGIKFF